MRTHLLALATSVALLVTFGSFETGAQQRSGYGSGWHDQEGDGYGRGRSEERSEVYGRSRGDRGEGYGRGRRDDRDDRSGRRGPDRRDDLMMEHGMIGRGMMGRGQMGPGMMGPAMMRMMLVLMDTDGDGTVSLNDIFKALIADIIVPAVPIRRRWLARTTMRGSDRMDRLTHLRPTLHST
jgi:hypothetical protein